MKKILLILALLPLFSANAFSDVPDDHPHGEAIDWAKEKGIVQGYPDGTFRPDEFITRAEFLKVLLEAESPIEQECDEKDIAYSDVDKNAWYVPYITKATQCGIVNGYPDGSFKPEQFVTYAEVAKMVVEWFELKTPKKQDLNWYQNYIRTIEISMSKPRDGILPDDTITRGGVSSIIYSVGRVTKYDGVYGGGNLDVTDDIISAWLVKRQYKPFSNECLKIEHPDTISVIYPPQWRDTVYDTFDNRLCSIQVSSPIATVGLPPFMWLIDSYNWDLSKSKEMLIHKFINNYYTKGGVLYGEDIIHETINTTKYQAILLKDDYEYSRSKRSVFLFDETNRMFHLIRTTLSHPKKLDGEYIRLVESIESR